MTVEPTAARLRTIETDPVLRRRAVVARWARVATRSGYLLLAVATALVAVGVATGFSAWVAWAATGCLVAGAVLLGPAILLGFAVRAAEREDAGGRSSD